MKTSLAAAWVKQKVGARTCIALFIDQPVERERRQIVGVRLDQRILLQIEDLQVTLALVACLGTSRCFGGLVVLVLRKRKVLQAPVGLARRAFDAFDVPLCRAQRA